VSVQIVPIALPPQKVELMAELIQRHPCWGNMTLAQQ
jgi:hypothetical protein